MANRIYQTLGYIKSGIELILFPNTMLETSSTSGRIVTEFIHFLPMIAAAVLAPQLIIPAIVATVGLGFIELATFKIYNILSENSNLRSTVKKLEADNSRLKDRESTAKKLEEASISRLRDQESTIKNLQEDNSRLKDQISTLEAKLSGKHTQESRGRDGSDRGSDRSDGGSDAGASVATMASAPGGMVAGLAGKHLLDLVSPRKSGTSSKTVEPTKSLFSPYAVAAAVAAAEQPKEQSDAAFNQGFNQSIIRNNSAQRLSTNSGNGSVAAQHSVFGTAYNDPEAADLSDYSSRPQPSTPRAGGLPRSSSVSSRTSAAATEQSQQFSHADSTSDLRMHNAPAGFFSTILNSPQRPLQNPSAANSRATSPNTSQGRTSETLKAPSDAGQAAPSGATRSRAPSGATRSRAPSGATRSRALSGTARSQETVFSPGTSNFLDSLKINR